MSSIFQGLLDANGRIRVSNTGPIVSYFRGLPFNAAGEIVGGTGPVTHFSQGIPFNAAGAVVGLQSTQPTDYGPGATPYGPNGELEFAPVGVVDHFYQGVPYNANGLYCTSGAAGAPVIVSKDFTLTPAVISPSSAGFRAAPAAGTLAPDAVYAGGTIVLVQAVDDDEFRVQNTGSVEFAGISGNLAVQIGPYIGSGRLVLTWDDTSGWYFTNQPGIYAYMVQQIGLPTSLRLSAAPAGTA